MAEDHVGSQSGALRALTVRLPARTFERMAITAATRHQHLGEFVVESVEARLDSLRDDVRESVEELFNDAEASVGPLPAATSAAVKRTVRTAKANPRPMN